MRPLPRLSLSHIRRPPALDRSLVGISFVDVLFALVIGRVLSVATRWDALTAPGLAHVVLAFCLTVASWIGYHNSLNRPRFFIRFGNLPLVQFLIDVGLVIAYWFTAAYVDGPDLGLREISAIPETNLVFVCFALYLCWDQVAYRIRKSELYPQTPLELDNEDRRRVTQLFSFLALCTMVVVSLLWKPHGEVSVVLVDTWLILLIVGFRVAKEATVSVEIPSSPVKDELDKIRTATDRALASLSLKE